MKKNIIENVSPLDIEQVFSEVMFLKHKQCYVCGVWVSDDPASALKKFPEYYESSLKQFAEELIYDQKITLIEGAYYWVSDVEKYI